MSKFGFIGFCVLVLAVALIVEPGNALAASSGGAAGAGSAMSKDVADLITGNLGAVIGLGVSLFGLWLWLMQQNSWGLAILIFGAAITAFPGLFNSVQSGFISAFNLQDATIQTGSGAN